MSNPDGHPNSNIAEYGKATRFGSDKGIDPAEATRIRNEEYGHPNSIRGSIRRIATMTRAELEQLANDPRLTMGQLVAIKKFMAATGKNPSIAAMDKLEDSVDGKLVEKKVEVKTDSYAALVAAAEALDKAGKNGGHG